MTLNITLEAFEDDAWMSVLAILMAPSSILLTPLYFRIHAPGSTLGSVTFVISLGLGRLVGWFLGLEALASEKRSSREHRGRNRLMAACSSAETFLQNVALHGGHLGGTTTRLLHLLEQYGASELNVALAEACRRGAFAAQSVAHVLDQRRRARKAHVPLPAVLPNDPRVRDLVVPTRPLSKYDALARSGDKKRSG